MKPTIHPKEVIMLLPPVVIGIGWCGTIVASGLEDYGTQVELSAWIDVLLVLGIALGCGIGLEMVWLGMRWAPTICPRCGATLPSTATRCHLCGHVIDEC